MNRKERKETNRPADPDLRAALRRRCGEVPVWSERLEDNVMRRLAEEQKAAAVRRRRLRWAVGTAATVVLVAGLWLGAGGRR